MMYVITGSTGNIGSRAVDLLLDRGEKVRVIVRDTSGLQRFVDRGAEAATGNLKDWGFLSKAFSGATAVFTMIPPNYTAGDFRAYQSEIGTSIANALKNSGVRHVVNLSSQGAHLSDGTDPIKGLHDQEELLNGIQGVHVLHLRPTYFMENLLMNIPLIKQKGITGSAGRGDLKFARPYNRRKLIMLSLKPEKPAFAGFFCDRTCTYHQENRVTYPFSHSKAIGK